MKKITIDKINDPDTNIAINNGEDKIAQIKARISSTFETKKSEAAPVYQMIWNSIDEEE